MYDHLHSHKRCPGTASYLMEPARQAFRRFDFNVFAGPHVPAIIELIG